MPRVNQLLEGGSIAATRRTNSSLVQPRMRNRFRGCVCPVNSENCDTGTPSFSPSSSTTTWFALPRSGAAVTATFKQPPCTPLMAFSRAPACTRTGRITPSGCSRISITVDSAPNRRLYREKSPASAEIQLKRPRVRHSQPCARYQAIVSSSRTASGRDGEKPRSRRAASPEQAQLGASASRILSRLSSSARPRNRLMHSCTPATHHAIGPAIGSTGAQRRASIGRTSRPRSA